MHTDANSTTASRASIQTTGNLHCYGPDYTPVRLQAGAVALCPLTIGLNVADGFDVAFN